jgi:predicted ribosomally synthesized peptide with nif11-like leader
MRDAKGIAEASVSQPEIERFVRDLKTDTALLAEVGKRAQPAAVAALATQRGYGFTVDELQAFVLAQARAVGKELSPDDLDQASGGNLLADMWDKMVPGVRY